MSKLRQAKRKKLKKQKARKQLARKIKNDEFIPTFDGYLKFYLDGELSDLIQKMEATGDWAINRNQIIHKDRKFHVNIHIVDKEGVKRRIFVLDLEDKGDDEVLAAAIREMASDLTAEAKLEEEADGKTFEADFKASHAVVRA